MSERLTIHDEAKGRRMMVTARLITGRQGFLGYRLTQGTSWTTGGGYDDWSGCYIGTTLAQALGYVGVESGVVRVWSCNLVSDYPLWCIHGSDIADPSIRSDDKARMVAKAITDLGQPVSSPLIPSLCAAGQGYVGPDSDDSLEIILGWNCVGAITYTAFRDYRIDKYTIAAWRTPDTDEWKSMSAEPDAPKPSIGC